MLFSKTDEAQIVACIREAERNTSGEIRLYIEDFCLRDFPLERAQELFQLFGMFNTRQRNAVLLYIAEKSHHFAIWGDAGIHEKVGFHFWTEEKKLLQEHFKRDEACKGVCEAIKLIGDHLKKHFPSDPHEDHNELPDDIIYG